MEKLYNLSCEFMKTKKRENISGVFCLVVQVYQQFFFPPEDSGQEVVYIICLLSQQVTWIADFPNFASSN